MRLITLLLLQSLKDRPLRSLLSVLGIVIGVAGILSIGITNQTALGSVEKVFNSTAGRASLVVTTASSDGKGIPENLLRRQIASVSGIQFSSPVVRIQTLIADDTPQSQVGVNFFGTNLGGLLLFGINPEIDMQTRDYQVVEGRFLSNNLDGKEVVLVKGFAEDKKLKVGDRVAFATPNGVDRFRLVGLISKDGPGQLNNGSFGVIPLRVAQKTFNRTGYFDQVDLVLTSEMNTTTGQSEIKTRLQSELGPDYPVIAPASQGSRMTQMLNSYQIGLNFMSGIALFVGAFLIYNAFSMTVVERTREYGMLRTVGMTGIQIFLLVLVEALITGIVGSALGAGLGYFLSTGLTELMGVMLNQEMGQVILPFDSLVTSLVIGIFATLIAAFIPAWQAARITPLAALRVRGLSKPGGWLRNAWFLGMVMLLVSGYILYQNPFPYDVQFRAGSITVFCLFLGGTLLIPAFLNLWQKIMSPVVGILYGSSGKLGSGNIQRQVLRTALTVAALMIGVSMIVVVQSMTSSFKGDLFDWINAYIGGDLFVTSSVPMRSDLQRRLQAVEGISWITPLRYLDVKWIKNDGSDESLTMMAIDPLTYGKVASLLFTDPSINPSLALVRMAGGDAVFISSVISEKYGYDTGDRISFRTRSGVRSFTIAGVVVDFYNQGLVVHGSWQDVRRYYRVEDASAFLVKVEPNASISNIQAMIDNQYGKQDHLTIESNISIKERIMQLLNQAFSMFDVLAILAVIVASLGVINTLTMNVLERTQEIGMLRSIGMTRWQVLGMILAEALVIGLAGGVLGLGFGYVLSRIFILSMTAMSGYRLQFNIPQESIVISLVVVLLVSQFAAILPAIKASRIRILDAIQYE